MCADLQKPFLHTVLVAIPDDWYAEVQRRLEQNGYSVIVATSRDTACTILQETHWNGAIIISFAYP